MTDRILFLGSLRNPLGQAWAESLAIAGNEVLMRTADGLVARWQRDGRRVAVGGGGRAPADAKLEAALDGGPDVIFAWWGTGALGEFATLGERFPTARRVLCVDTFPNASQWLSEVRERRLLRSLSSEVDGLVYPSAEMRALHVEMVPALLPIPWLALPQPLPARAHARSVGSLPPELVLPDGDRPRVVLTGRSDLLWTRDPRMRKDALGSMPSR